jgi:hypothetical protein
MFGGVASRSVATAWGRSAEPEQVLPGPWRHQRIRVGRPGLRVDLGRVQRTSETASSIIARTGVMPRMPMISALVINVPSQCETLMTS